MFKNIFRKQTEAEKFIKSNEKRYYWNSNMLLEDEDFKGILKKPQQDIKSFILDLTNTFSTRGFYKNDSYQEKLKTLSALQALLRRNLNYNEKEWIALMNHFIKADDTPYTRFGSLPINYSIQQIERYLKSNEPSEELTKFIKYLLEHKVFSKSNSNDLDKPKLKLKKIIAKEKEISEFKLLTNDIGPSVNKIISAISEHKVNFSTIFLCTSGASQSKPTKKFQNIINKEIDIIGKDNYRKVAQELLKIAIDRNIYKETKNYTYDNGRTYEWVEGTFLCAPSQNFIKGIVWTMQRFSDKETINLLSRLFEKSYEKIPGQGPAAAALGNACAYTLGNMRGKDGLGALSRIKLKLRQNNIKKIIDKYLEEGAKKYNVSVEELKEMAVPDFKLENGSKTLEFDGYGLRIEIIESKVKQYWFKPDGNPMKSVPTLVKKSKVLNNKLKEARREIKEIQKTYSAQKQRIDNQFILNRTWNYDEFNKYYFSHGLVNTISKKLVWTFINGKESFDAIFIDGKWKGINGNEMKSPDTRTKVKLWHPVNADENTIVAWREKIMELQWRQPIKQVYREIYILTDAEINTKSYSNRMAAHILKQHQFNALAGLRGWKYSLLGWFDDGRNGEVCQRFLPEYNLTAEYWIDELNQDDAYNDTGIWHYISTDQVKFKNNEDQTIDLIDIPKIVFTEIMRDVDLFVGVCSVGNDPEWADNNGERQNNRDYWHAYSFGDLTEIAKTRKVILERLLPRLKKIRDVAQIEGKFLKVEGKLRTYKIHIGSGNILMEPNDQYLCIVPSRSAEKTTDKLFIPFEGDKGLSIVLSKAFLLAEDHKITDKSITSQIKR